MSKSELLAAFASFPEPHGIRESPGASEVLARLPSSPDAYVAFVREYYGSLTRAIWDSWREELAEFYRVEAILRELLYADGRTLEAFVWVVGWASRREGLAEIGINPLAAIRGLCDRPLPRMMDQEVVRQLEEWIIVPDLEHNARECRNAILRRRPDLPRESSGA